MKMFFFKRRIISVFVFILAFSFQICAAQPGHEGIGGISLQGAFIGSADFKNKDSRDPEGEMESITSGAAISFYDFSMGYNYTSFKWNQVKHLPFGNGKDDPWENLHSISIGYGHSDMVNNRWGYFSALGASSEFEKEMADSFGGMGYAGFIINLPDYSLMIRLGGGAAYNPVETQIIPIIGIDWNSHAEDGFTVSIGLPATQIAYRFSPGTSFSLGLGFGESGVYRLADDSYVEKEGYLEMKSLGAMLAFTFSPVELCSVTIGGGMSFNREYRIYDKDGENEREYELDNAAGGFASISAEF